MSKVFLSHSTKDKNLVQHYLKLLQGFGIHTADIYCTSLEGTITPGEQFIPNIQKNIEEANVVIPLITENYLDSLFCIAEMGAAWALKHRIYPIIVPPVTYSRLESSPLKGIQAVNLTVKTDVVGIYHHLKDTFSVIERPVNPIQMIVAVDTFLEELPQKYTSNNRQQYVPQKKYDELSGQVDDAIKIIKKKDSTIRELEAYVGQLEKVKNTEEILALKIQYSDVWETFIKHVEQVKSELKNLDNIVVSSIYFGYRSEEYWPNRQNEYIWDKIRELELDNFIKIDDGVEPNWSHPKIRKADEFLTRFQNFTKSYMEAIQEIFEEKYEEPFSLISRPVWGILFNAEILI
jgi:hypothetical protein